MSARLAAAPITWGVCELPDWGQVPPYERVLEQMQALGFQGTELGPDGYLPSDPPGLRRALAQRGLALIGAFCPLVLTDAAQHPASLEGALSLARRLAESGCDRLIAADAGDERRRAIAGRVMESHNQPQDVWRRAGALLAGVAERCRPLGVSVSFHQHAGTYVESAAELDALMAATPAQVGLCLATGHLVYGGADPVAVAQHYGSRVDHVHAKDVRPDVLARVRAQGTDYSTAVGEGVFAPLGDGTVDFADLIQVLRAHGYDGWYVLEQDVRLGRPWPDQDPLENARRSRDFLRALLAG